MRSERRRCLGLADLGTHGAFRGRLSIPAFLASERADMKAIWNGATIAESDDTVVVEGNHYFPEASLKREYVTFSNHRSMLRVEGPGALLQPDGRRRR